MGKTKRITISLTDEELKEIEKLLKRGDYRSRSDVARIAIKKLIDQDRERRAIAVRGLTMSLHEGKKQLDKKTIEKILDALEYEESDE